MMLGFLKLELSLLIKQHRNSMSHTILSPPWEELINLGMRPEYSKPRSRQKEEPGNETRVLEAWFQAKGGTCE